MILTAANPHGYRWLSDNAWLEGSTDKVVYAMHNLFVHLPTERSIAMFFCLAPLRTLPDMALSLQTEIYCASYIVYESEEQDAPLRQWLSERMREMEPITKGHFWATRIRPVVKCSSWAAINGGGCRRYAKDMIPMRGLSAESGATRTPIPAQGGQHSGDCGQPVMAA